MQLLDDFDLFSFQSNEFDDLKDKLRKYMSSSSALNKLFKMPGGAKTPVQEEDFNIRTTDSTKAFTRPGYAGTPSKAQEAPNETIVEGKELVVLSSLDDQLMNTSLLHLVGELNVLNEAEMNVITFPATPQKGLVSSSRQGVSSQILPLSRLSSGNSPEAGTQDAATLTLTSNATVKTSTVGSQTPKPVKEKLTRLRKSLAEPLLQYFHELQVSPESEEPEVLNTPRSLAPANSICSPRPPAGKSKKSRSLFSSKASDKDEAKEYENMPPITITDM